MLWNPSASEARGESHLTMKLSWMENVILSLDCWLNKTLKQLRGKAWGSLWGCFREGLTEGLHPLLRVGKEWHLPTDDSHRKRHEGAQLGQSASRAAAEDVYSRCSFCWLQNPGSSAFDCGLIVERPVALSRILHTFGDRSGLLGASSLTGWTDAIVSASLSIETDFDGLLGPYFPHRSIDPL